MKSRYFLLLLLAFMCNSVFSQFRINEYSCSNVGAVQDPLGAGNATTGSPDWIEIHTASVTTQTLSGWYLSDDRHDLRKWQVPYFNNQPIKLDSNTYQVIFLCGHNKCVTTGGTIAGGAQTLDLHTNFQLNQTKKGTTIYLTQVSGTHPYDSVVVRPTKPDHSRGKFPNTSSSFSTGAWKLYSQNSAGKYNPGPGTPTFFYDYTPTPKFSIKPGYYSGQQTITISDTTSLSASHPGFETFASNDCTPPINILASASVTDLGPSSTPGTFQTVTGGGCVVRAIIIDQSVPPMYLPSFEAYGAYVIDSLFKMSATCLCVDTNSLFIGRTKDTVYTVYGYVGIDKKEKIHNQGQALIKKIDFYNKTGATSIRSQWQFQFKAEDEYGYNYSNLFNFYTDPTLGGSTRADFPELTFRSASEENFLGGGMGGANGFGATHMRDFYNHTLNLRHDINFEAAHYVPTYLYINGVSRGIYYIKEPMDSTYTGYYFNHPQADIIANDIVPTTTTQRQIALSGKIAHWSGFYNWAMSNAANVHSSSTYAALQDSLDFPSFCDYTIFNMLSVNADYVKRYALWWKGQPTDSLDTRTSKWRFGLTNTDVTWGFNANNYNNIGNTNPDNTPCDFVTAFGTSASPNFPLIPLYAKLMTNDSFKSEFITRYSDLLNTAYSCDSLTDHLKYVRSLLKTAIPSHVFWTLSNSSFQGDSTHFWNAMADSLNLFLTQRCSLVLKSIQNCYQNLDGPYNLCVDVYPPNSGYVKLNSLTLHSFVWNGKYLDSVTNIAHAIPDSNYVFDHWETPFNISPGKTSDSANFYINQDGCMKAIFRLKDAYETYGTPMLPTGFSPNGDGNNDVLNVYGTANASSFDLIVYNRWGEELFHSSDKTQGWDGKYNGVDSPVGVYAYRYNIVINGKTYTKKGSVTLLR